MPLDDAHVFQAMIEPDEAANGRDERVEPGPQQARQAQGHERVRALERARKREVADVTEQIPGPVSAKSLALGGGGAYFLDQEQQRVIAVALVVPDTKPFPLFAAGDLVAAEITGAPRHIAWSDDHGALLIMDDANRLIAVAPGEAGRLLTVRDSAAWEANGIAIADGSLYVLDRAGEVRCFGADEEGQCQGGEVVALPGPAVEIRASASCACARLESGEIACWGRPDEGQQGSFAHLFAD